MYNHNIHTLNTDSKFLIDRLKNGNETAYELLFKEYYKVLVIFASKYLKDVEASKELVQELFVHIYEKRENLDINSSLKSYLFRSVHNRSINLINSKTFFDDIYRLYSDQAKLKGVELINLSDQSFDMMIDPELIKQSLMNLVQNAIDAVEKKGKVEINYFKKSDNLIIEVTDNGRGIPAEIKNKIFDLYYTTKPEGTGLGLSIVQKIVAEHNATIEVFSEVNKYTKFKITIPQK